MKCSLNAVTVANKRVLKRLDSYLDKMLVRFSNDLLGSRVRVFVDSQCDFCVFESVEYAIGFTSLDHTVRDVVTSRYASIDCSFDDFASYVRELVKKCS